MADYILFSIKDVPFLNKTQIAILYFVLFIILRSQQWCLKVRLSYETYQTIKIKLVIGVLQDTEIRMADDHFEFALLLAFMCGSKKKWSAQCTSVV